MRKAKALCFSLSVAPNSVGLAAALLSPLTAGKLRHHRKPSRLLQFPAAALAGWQDREGLGQQSQHSCTWPLVPKSLLTPASILKLGQIAVPFPPNETSAQRERGKEVQLQNNTELQKPSCTLVAALLPKSPG